MQTPPTRDPARGNDSYLWLYKHNLRRQFEAVKSLKCKSHFTSTPSTSSIWALFYANSRPYNVKDESGFDDFNPCFLDRCVPFDCFPSLLLSSLQWSCRKVKTPPFESPSFVRPWPSLLAVSNFFFTISWGAVELLHGWNNFTCGKFVFWAVYRVSPCHVGSAQIVSPVHIIVIVIVIVIKGIMIMWSKIA